MKFLVLGSCFLFMLMVTIPTSSAVDNTTLFRDTKDIELERKQCDKPEGCALCDDKTSCQKSDPTSCFGTHPGNGGKCVNGVCCPASCVENELDICSNLDGKCLGTGKTECQGKCCKVCSQQNPCDDFCNKKCKSGKGDHCECSAEGTCNCLCGTTGSACSEGQCISGVCVPDEECPAGCTRFITVDINGCCSSTPVLVTTEIVCQDARLIDTDFKSNYLLLDGSSW